MNELELSRRKQRAEEEPLVITKTKDGFRIFSAANPSKFYLVRQVDGRPTCNCMDFEKNSLDPTWRCKHILKAFGIEEIASNEVDEEREAIRAEANGEPVLQGAEFPSIPKPHSRLLIKRSISPDGRIDSVSLEMDLQLNGEPPAMIKMKALKALQLEGEIASAFVASQQLHKELNGTGKPQSVSKAQPTNGTSQQATLQNIGVMPGKWGPRYFVNVDVQGRRAKLFGTPKQIADAIQAAGYNFPVASVSEGVALEIPCRVTTKQNGQYLNIEKVFPVE